MSRYTQDEQGQWWYTESRGIKRTDPHRRRAQWYHCIKCGTEYLSYPKEVRRQHGYCSSGCGHSLPQGTCRTTEGGYVEVKEQEGWVLEHRAVMAEAIGRALLPTESVHHINGDRADNKLGNLQLRSGAHGAGQAHACLDCGSHNVIAIAIKDVEAQESLI